MYEKDLAAFHDAYAMELGHHGGVQLVDELHAAGFRRGRVLDLGCGSGAATEPIAAAGFSVTGVDVSPSMLALARKRVKGATFVEASLADVELPRGLVGISAISEVISYAADLDLDDLLADLHDALRPGGILLLDVVGPGRHSLDGGPTRAFESEDAVLLMRTWTSGARLTRRITMFTRVGKGERWRRSDEKHELRMHHEEDVRASLARAGFVGIRALERYHESEVTFAPHWPAFVAARP